MGIIRSVKKILTLLPNFNGKAPTNHLKSRKISNEAVGGLTAILILNIDLVVLEWAKLGINISNFPFSLSALGFHLGLGGIFTLFGLFWMQLNMFQTLKYLLGLGIVTFLCGNKLLARIAASRKKHAH